MLCSEAARGCFLRRLASADCELLKSEEPAQGRSYAPDGFKCSDIPDYLRGIQPCMHSEAIVI